MTDTDLHAIADDYLRRVRDALRPLPPTERAQVLDELDAYLRTELAERPGMSSDDLQQTITRLGTPEEIAESALPVAGNASRPRRRVLVTIVAAVVAALIVSGVALGLTLGQSSVASPVNPRFSAPQQIQIYPRQHATNIRFLSFSWFGINKSQWVLRTRFFKPGTMTPSKGPVEQYGPLPRLNELELVYIGSNGSIELYNTAHQRIPTPGAQWTVVPTPATTTTVPFT